MHYCLLLITKEFPTNMDIAAIMAPYDEENIKYDENDKRITPYRVFDWDWYEIGGGYSGMLKLKIDPENEEYNWQYYAREGRNGRLFHSRLLSEVQSFAKDSRKGWMFREEDYFREMGKLDGFLRVDGAKIADLLNFDEAGCFVCIDKDGNAIARESWNGHDFIKDEEFDEKLKIIKESSKDCYATIIDIHD